MEPTVTEEQQLEVVSGLLRILVWARRSGAPKGISSTAYSTLDSLAFVGPLRISDLAEREGITQPGMTGLINRLESEGLAVRTADPSDRRAALVCVTDAGRTAITAVRAQRAAGLAAQLHGLDPVDQAALLAAIPAMDRLISANRSVPNTPPSVPIPKFW